MSIEKRNSLLEEIKNNKFIYKQNPIFCSSIACEFDKIRGENFLTKISL